MKKNLMLLALFAGLTACVPDNAQAAEEEVVNIYSYRQPYLIEPMLKAFTDETGIKTNVVFAKEGIFERVKAEGEHSPADLVFTVDIANLVAGAENHGISQPIVSEVVEKNIPENFIAKDKKWVGLTKRVRLIAVSKDRMKLEEAPKTYEDLADPKYKGKICIRSGKNNYNVSLLASIIAAHDEAYAQKWLQGLKDNLARAPQGNDRAQVKAIAEGICDIAVLNNYYLGNMLFEYDEKAGKVVPNEKQKGWVEAVNVIYPNQAENDRGAHANISGVLLTKYAPNKANALKLIEFLTGDKAQHMYAEVNNEFPLKKDVEASELVKQWGTPKVDPVDMNKIANLREKALLIIDKVQFDGE